MSEIKYIYRQITDIKYIFNIINMYFIKKNNNSIEIYKQNLSNVDWEHVHYY